MKQLEVILKQVLERIEPPNEDIEYIEKYLKKFLIKLKEKIKIDKIEVEVFVGGSFAKKTLIKKDNYDVDIFLRFNKKYGDKISSMTKDLLKQVEGVEVIHGSRDYFRIKVNPHFSIELIPVIKVKNTKESKNITDLSYSHVKYINNKIKNKKILNEIKILKAFCYANKCYGAESYVMGFSGYALELLIIYSKSFIHLLKEIIKSKDKIIIDIEKDYKNKSTILMDLNSSKLHSPIILIDPTFKQRNAAAALSKETFDRFKKAAKKFLEKPSIKYFEIKKIDVERLKKISKKNKFEFIELEFRTDKQEGDIAGSKLLKFFKYLSKEIKKNYEIKKEEFIYPGQKKCKVIFIVKPKKEIVYSGPNENDIENIKKFKVKHQEIFKIKNKIFAKEKVNQNLKEYFIEWVQKNKNIYKEMYISEIKLS